MAERAGTRDETTGEKLGLRWPDDTELQLIRRSFERSNLRYGSRCPLTGG